MDKVKSASFVARQLVRSARKGTLCTNGKKNTANNGWPLGSLVTFATAWDGSPILMLSDLAEHTKNLLADKRVSLFVDGTEGFVNPQEGPRVCVIGNIDSIRNIGLEQRFLNRHPRAQMYRNFSDFDFYMIEVEQIYYIGGFARALLISKEKSVLRREDWRQISNSEAEILENMNSNHREDLLVLGTKVLGARGKHWKMVGIDPEGVDLQCGESFYRVEFNSLVRDVGDYTRVLANILKDAKRG